MTEPRGTITVSEDKLYRALAEFKNDLIEELTDKFERKADVIQLTDARKEVIDLNKRVAALERWRSYLAGACAASLALVGFIAQHLF